jgi:hypothetical protein
MGKFTTVHQLSNADGKHSMGRFTTVHQLSNADGNMVWVNLQQFTNYQM